MTRALDSEFVERYASLPPRTTINQAISLHENIRKLLGDSEYATLLQGSYKNDTCLSDMNDVDIVAVRRDMRSRQFSYSSYQYQTVDWDQLFTLIEQKLQSARRYQGKWERGDKCIKLNTGVSIDIVPAVVISGPTDDPIAIYSFSERQERKNWPRTHHQNNANKSSQTSGNYKQAVRLFKRWVKAHFGSRKVATSYHIECLLHSLSNHLFSGDLAQDFVSLGDEILRQYPHSSHSWKTLRRIAGDGDLLSPSEWNFNDFREFSTTLQTSLSHARTALRETNQERARSAWRAAFNGQ